MKVARNRLSAANPALALCAVLFALCVSAHAQQAKRVFRIGYLSGSDAASESTRAEAIRLALRELGYIEGQNIAVEYRYAEGKVDRFPELAAELVRLKVDIIVVVGGGRAPLAAKNATKTIPIIMVGAGIDPVEAGLVESFARPGGNVTGLANLSGELGGKRLELLKEAVPKLTSVAVLYDSASPGSVREVKEVPVAARALELTIQSWEVSTADDFNRAFGAIGKQRPDGLYVRGGRVLSNNQKRIVGFALRNRLPSIHALRESVNIGGLMYYGGRPGGQLPARCLLCGQNSQGRQACGVTYRTTHKVRAGDQSENREADRSDDSAEGPGAGGQSDSVRRFSI